jgi:serine/threonine protein kinase
VKPANILLKGNQLKLGDFGLARVISNDDGKHPSSFFTFAGTPHYMAP